MSSAIAAIPAHLASKRVPRKVLLEIKDRPLLWHVWRQTVESEEFSRVVIVSGDEEILDLANSWKAEALRTPRGLSSGTERIAAIVDQLGGECIVNVQADMPHISAELFRQMLSAWDSRKHKVLTPVFRVRDAERLLDPNLVKVVRDSQGRAMYFSRQVVPYLRDVAKENWIDAASFYGHIGIYAYHSEMLRAFGALPQSALEVAERLEQLRFLASGIPVHTVETDYVPMAIDALGDIDRFQKVERQDLKVPVP
jgi:3-deoxy-manno-octulosonate cytidylyltransferase (CMP-KDO synthetase)